MDAAIGSLMLRLLRVEISGAEVPREAEPLDDATLRELYRLSSAHDLAGTVGDALLAARAFSQDSPMKALFDRAALTAVYRFERIRHTLDAVKKILSDARVPHIPLKGAVIRDLYPDPAMRTSSDIDVLVAERDLPAAKEALSAAGYRKTPNGTLHDVTYIAPNDVHVELHFALFDDESAATAILSRVFEDAVPEVSGAFTYRMSPELFWFYHYAHTAKHFARGGCGVRTVADLYVMRKGMPCDKDAVAAWLEEAGLATFASVLDRLERYWFEDGEPDPLILECEAYILEEGICGTEESVTAAEQRKKSKFRAVLETVFLPYRSMTVKFPVLKKWPVLLPLFWIVRWFHAVFRGTAKKGVDQIRRTATADAGIRDRIDELAKKVGL